MPVKIELRNQRVSDAKRFFKMLDNPNFKYLQVCPENLEGEIEFLRGNAEKRKKNLEHNFAIIYGGKLVGGCGIKIDQHRPFIGEIGYFVDEAYWGKSIAPRAVKLLEKIGFSKFGLERIEIKMTPKNIASKKVAIKCGYKKEGLLKKAMKDRSGYYDIYLYAKIK